jgi:hypothetical protein
MPATIEVIREDARYHAFALNLDIARPVLESAPDLAVASRATVLPRGLDRSAKGRPDQGRYN